MIHVHLKQIAFWVIVALTGAATGCTSINGFGHRDCDDCETCDSDDCDGCKVGEACEDCDGCSDCQGAGCPVGVGAMGYPCHWWRSHAIPDKYPLGSVVRAHYHTMQANGEATDFVLFRSDFVAKTAELTPDGKDRILEIGARMRSAPFPVVVERSEHNSDPELDAVRRELVAEILTDLGNPDAGERVFVAPPYGRHLNSREAQSDYFRFLFTRGTTGNGAFGGGFGGFGGGFGGGGGGVGF